MIEIKKFTFDNSELMKIAHQIRHIVFVIGQNCPEELEWEYEEESTHFLVLDNGLSRLFDADSEASLHTFVCSS